MYLQVCIYVIAIALQFLGAILMIVSYWMKPVKEQVDEVNEKVPHIEDELFMIRSQVPTNDMLAKQISFHLNCSRIYWWNMG